MHGLEFYQVFQRVIVESLAHQAVSEELFFGFGALSSETMNSNIERISKSSSKALVDPILRIMRVISLSLAPLLLFPEGMVC